MKKLDDNRYRYPHKDAVDPQKFEAIFYALIFFALLFVGSQIVK